MEKIVTDFLWGFFNMLFWLTIFGMGLDALMRAMKGKNL